MPRPWQGCARAQSLFGDDTLRLLHLEYRITAVRDWDDPRLARLWRYNAHYFDDLAADGAPTRADAQRALIVRWIAENPAANGTGWEPYPTALRLVNWIKWAWAGNTLPPGFDDSLAQQARWLRGNLEWHLLGNHLWADAKALVFAGAYFGGDEGDAWLRKGLQIVDAQLREQVLPDGGHFELAPMYHAIVLEDLLDLVQLGTRLPAEIGEARRAHWSGQAQAMLGWLQAMSHPDGGPAFFNDTTCGIAAALVPLQDYARALDLSVPVKTEGGLTVLPDSGYLRLQVGPALLIADAGRIGPDYLPGHAHADTLSFELSLRGRRMLVNQGISTYEPNAERLRQRGTAAHNALELDGIDSSEVWSGFRVGRRARPRDVAWAEEAGTLTARGGHDGYRWRPDSPIVRRAWRLRDGELVIEDDVDYADGASARRQAGSRAIVRFHLHPDWTLRLVDAASGQFDGPAGRVHLRIEGAASASVEPGSWHPGFNLPQPSQCLRIVPAGNALVTRFQWT